jgi:hypothetical protein|tara:strand:+ start:533 stop:715 length:183 start_codon:yes stop_codon:yes gene_type:complete
MATDRPNIVLLVNDHQAYYRHGWDGGVKPIPQILTVLLEKGHYLNGHIVPLRCVGLHGGL